MGLFRSVRTLVKEFLNFGNEEINQLKQQLEKQKAQLEQLKQMRKQREEHEEQLILSELRRAVQQMQNVDRDRTVHEKAVVDAVDELGMKMQKIMEHDMEERAVRIMQSIDFQEVLTGVPSTPQVPTKSTSTTTSPATATPCVTTPHNNKGSNEDDQGDAMRRDMQRNANDTNRGEHG